MPRPPHTSALGVPDENFAAGARLGERGAWRGALMGNGPLSLWEQGGSARTEGFAASSEAFPTRGRPYT